MRYLLLIYSDEAHYPKMSEQEMGQLMGEYMAFGEEFGAKTQGAERLQPTPTATTVRVRNEDTVTTDGPFAETKEQLGGYYLIDVKDLDEATAWAEKVPSATYGSIEIRPVWEAE